MNYGFTAILIVLMCLLAFCVRPVDHTPLKLELKDIIIPLPKPKGIDNEAWNEIE
tara:strand:- start:167 stop:331 length:165 start_codon:yes stop_codon:yes gene_type:complete